MTPARTHGYACRGSRRLHYVAAGSGPLVILIHGFPDFWRCWDDQIDVLADQGYRAVAIDLIGYGRSSKPTDVESYSITPVIDDLAGLVAHFDEDTAHVVGHDWGAMIGWTAAWTRPEVFTSVIGLGVPFGGRAMIPLAGCSSFGERRPSEAQRLFGGPNKQFYLSFLSTPGLMESYAEPDVGSFIRGLRWAASGRPGADPGRHPLAATTQEVLAAVRESRACFGPGEMPRYASVAPPPDPPYWFRDIEDYVAEFERTGIVGGLNYYRALDQSWAQLEPFAGRPLTVPAMFLAGTQDLPVLWGAEAIAQYGVQAPGMRDIVLISGVGHWVNREAPELTNEHILGFLQSVRSPT